MNDAVPPADTLLTTAEVATLLRKSKRTIEDWRLKKRANGLPFVNAGNPRYRRSDVEKFIESNLQQTTPQP